jgi:hypothetical protein
MHLRPSFARRCQFTQAISPITRLSPYESLAADLFFSLARNPHDPRRDFGSVDTPHLIPSLAPNSLHAAKVVEACHLVGGVDDDESGQRFGGLDS